MNHLDVVPRASLANPVTARFTEGLGSSSLEDWFDGGPGGCGTARHEGRTMAGTFLSSRNTRTDEQEALLLKFLRPSDGIGIVRVTTIYNDVALLEVGN